MGFMAEINKNAEAIAQLKKEIMACDGLLKQLADLNKRVKALEKATKKAGTPVRKREDHGFRGTGE